MPSMAAVWLLFQPVAASVARMCCRSMSASEAGLELAAGGSAMSPVSPAVASLRERQVVGLDELAARQHHGPLDDVLQLADVARPAILAHQLHRLRREAASLRPVSALNFCRK